VVVVIAVAVAAAAAAAVTGLQFVKFKDNFSGVHVFHA
jgi:hypothetical protein